MKQEVMNKEELKKIAEGIEKGIYRTFTVAGRKVIVDDFIYRRLFRDAAILPHRKYTFLRGFRFNNYPSIVLKTKNHKSIALPRYIMRAGKGEVVDHRNRNTLDNRRCNLRIVNHRQNTLNRKMKNNTGLLSVSVCKSKKQFCVRTQFITKEGYKLSFSCPVTMFNKILTALAHDKFVLQAGEEEYAPLNFPQWQFEPLRSILMKEDLSRYKERGGRDSHGRTLTKTRTNTDKKGKPKLNQKILRFCRKMAKNYIKQK